MDKTEETYEAFMNQVKLLVKSEPRSVQTDFELGLQNSVRTTWPNCRVYGCYFHFKQSIYRHIQSEGLASLYNDLTSEVRLYCKILACLAFVPVTEVVAVFDYVRSIAPKNVLGLFKYFESSYIGSKSRGKGARKEPRFPIDMWNVHGRTLEGMPRTSNNVEGWHNGFSVIVSNHPHLLKLIDAMKAEQSNTENKLVQIRTGLVQKRRPKYVILEERIVIVIGDYTTFLRDDGTENTASVMEWLTDMSYLVQF